MPILNYTTQIAASKTVGEVQAILAHGGADEVSVIYGGGQPTGVTFTLHTVVGASTFRMPVNIDGVLAVLTADRQVPTRFKNRDHAARVAWRVVKDWIEAQVALIGAGMASLDQVMLPYLELERGRTLFQAYQAQQPLMIESGDGGRS